MTTYQVNTSALSLIAQVAERQATHVSAARAHIDSFTSLGLGETGLILQAFVGPVAEGRQNAITGMSDAESLCDHVGESVRANRTAYLAAEQSAYDALTAAVEGTSIEFPPFSEPGPEPTLAPSAPAGPAICYPGQESDSSQKVYEAAGTLGKKAVSTYTSTYDLTDTSIVDQTTATHHANALRDRVINNLAERRGWTPDASQPTETFTEYMKRTAASNGQAAYDTRNNPALPPRTEPHLPADPRTQTDWSSGNYTQRGVGSALAIKDLWDNGVSAYEAIEAANEAQEGLDYVNSVADAKSNTANKDWANK